MKKSLLVCTFLSFVTATSAYAQATRTWVSGVGDDANPCSRTAPCKTFAGAISKTAAGGYINAIDPGGFGAVTITKSITIDGAGQHSGVLATLGTTGVIVNAAATDKVILRNLSIEGAGSGAHGIRVLAAAQVHVENVTISGFTQNGILVSSPPTSVYISDTTVKSGLDQGIYFVSGTGLLNRVTTTGNVGTGVLAGSAALVTVSNSVSSGNDSGYGAVFAAASQINIENCIITSNRYGVIVVGGASARLSNTTVISNTVSGIYNDGSSILVTFGNNKFTGNAADGAFNTSVAVR